MDLPTLDSKYLTLREAREQLDRLIEQCGPHTRTNMTRVAARWISPDGGTLPQSRVVMAETGNLAIDLHEYVSV